MGAILVYCVILSIVSVPVLGYQLLRTRRELSELRAELRRRGLIASEPAGPPPAGRALRPDRPADAPRAVAPGASAVADAPIGPARQPVARAPEAPEG